MNDSCYICKNNQASRIWMEKKNGMHAEISVLGSGVDNKPIPFLEYLCSLDELVVVEY